jgi:hypothetical protein
MATARNEMRYPPSLGSYGGQVGFVDSPIDGAASTDEDQHDNMKSEKGATGATSLSGNYLGVLHWVLHRCNGGATFCWMSPLSSRIVPIPMPT